MSSAGFGVPNGSGGYAFLVDQDGNTTVGDESSDVFQLTGSAYIAGPLVINDASADVDLRVESNNNENMLVVDAGNDRVGIGTGTPDEALEVAGNIKVAGDDPRIKIDGVTDSHPGLEFYENGTRKWIIFNNYGDDSLDFKTDSNTRMVIDQDGNVGIGTQSPDYTLDVAGNIGVDQYIYHNGDADTFINFTTDDINITAGDVNFIDITQGNNNEITFNETGVDIDFRVEGDTDTHLLFVEGGTDRVGIGTSSPSVTLDVAGDVNFDGAAVFNESSADKDFRVESNHQTHMFYIDGGNNRIGLGTSGPQFTIDVQERSGVEAVLRMMGDADVGIRLAADSDNSGENDNPYIDWYQDGQNSNSRNNRLASMAMEGDAAGSFTDSLANAFFMDAYCPGSTDSNLRTIQFANDSSNNGHKARITIEGTNGYVGIWKNTPEHALDVDGNTKSNYYITTPSTQDLGSGISSTLSIGSSLMFLDADSITGIDPGIGQDVHTLNLPNGTTSGQRLTLVVEGNMGAGNSVPIMIAGNLIGASDFLMPGSKTSLNFVYYSTAAISAWYQV